MQQQQALLRADLHDAKRGERVGGASQHHANGKPCQQAQMLLRRTSAGSCRSCLSAHTACVSCEAVRLASWSWMCSSIESTSSLAYAAGTCGQSTAQHVTACHRASAHSADGTKQTSSPRATRAESV